MSDAKVNQDRMSRTAVVGLSSGIFFILATLVAVALLNLPKSAVAEGSETPCPPAEVSLDQGYGVSRLGPQPFCHDAAAQGLSEDSVAK